MALLASVVAGLLVAAMALPVVGAVGLAAKQQADQFLVLPAELDTPPPPQRSRILAADGSLLAWLYVQNRVPVPLADVPEHTVDAVLAIEDARFYDHNGVDVKGTVRAALENAQEGVVTQGGSTLTQQYVKNALVQAAATPEELQAARESTVERKLREARYALALEQELSKDEILERYLNIAYYGNGVYGIGTAAQYYFGKPVQELTLPQSALLAGIVQSPETQNPVENPEAALDRRNVVLQRMHDVAFITEQQRADAAAIPISLAVTPIGSGCEASGAPFFCDHVRDVLENTEVGAALGKTRAERQQRLFGGGLTIRTTLDPKVQAAGQQAVNEAVPGFDPSGVAATFTAVEPGTGVVKAIAANQVFSEAPLPGHTKVNLPTGGSSGMQAGSAFKPFVLAAALEQGIPLQLTLRAPATYTSKVFKNCDGITCDEPYTVSNAGDSNAGVHDIVSATHGSVNTFYLQLFERTGIERPVEIAESLGLRQFVVGAPSAPLHRGGSFVLGVNEVSPLAMSAAYAAFAAQGKYCPPKAVTSVVDADGTPIPLVEQPCRQVLAPEIADSVSAVLRGNIDGPSRSRTGSRASIGRPAAGKTGSTNGSKAAWFVGYVPQLASAVWVGTPVPTELRRITINGRYYAQVYGGSLPAPIWADAMEPALAGVPVEDLPPMVFSDPQTLSSSSRSDDDEDDDEPRRSRRAPSRDAGPPARESADAETAVPGPPDRDGPGRGRGNGRGGD
jgi:membrane peptidoglycan carboxypeptidase